MATAPVCLTPPAGQSSGLGTMLILGLILIAIAVAGCGDQPGSCRCSGDTVECYTYDDDSHDDVWMKGAPCPDGTKCTELVLHPDNGGAPLDWAVCATQPDPSPMCEPVSGRFCVDDHHYATCLYGRLEEGSVACWDAAPNCFEPEPGLAFCVASTDPSPLCKGAPTRPTGVCAYSGYACTEVDMQQACLAGEQWVMCYDDVLIESTQCAFTGGTCAGTKWAYSSACRY